MSWGVKSSDLIRAFGLQRARPGERVYLTSEAEVATWSARVGDDGSLSDLPPVRPIRAGKGSRPTRRATSTSRPATSSCTTPSGKLIETIAVPGRPTQVVFGGPDRRTLFLPARDALYAVRTRSPGPVRRNITPRAGRARRGRS